MITYESVTNVRKDPRVQPFTLGDGTYLYGPYDAPAAPASHTYSYEPYEVTEEKSPVNSNGSWSRIRESGAIVMSPYFHRKTVRQNSIAASEFRSWNALKPSYYDPSKGTCLGSRDIKLTTSWSEQGDFRFWTENKAIVPLALNTLPDLAGDVASTQTDVIAAFNGGYDLLTELAELSKTMEFFSNTSKSAFKAFETFFKGVDPAQMRDYDRRGQTARDLLRSGDKAARSVGRKWLAFRYAILPVMYSYKDVYDLFKNRETLYRTYRSKRTHTLDNQALPSGLPGRFIVERLSGSIEVRSTLKAAYTKEGISSFLSNGVQFNVFSTAWELLPFSFVLDWFVNVGDFITASTSVSFASQSVGCTSVRERLIREVFLIDEADLTLRYDWNGSNPCSPSGIHFLDSKKNQMVSPLIVENIDNYDRTLFSVSDPTLAFASDPFQDLRRIADGVALSQRPLKSLYKKVFKR